MPCAAGELCHFPDLSPEPPDGHECRGGCGCRLHGGCGEIESETGHEYHRICHACSAKLKAKASSAATAATAKRKAQPESHAPKRTKPATTEPAKRTRLTLEQKVAVIAELDKRVSQTTLADRFKCSVRSIQSIKKDRVEILSMAQTVRGSQKSNRPGDFPEVRVQYVQL